MSGDPFQIDNLPDAPIARAALRAARPLLNWAMALNTYRALYVATQQQPSEAFESRALQALDIAPDISCGDLQRVPQSGPVIVAANHPHGLADGLVLIAALRQVRPDIRVLANYWLARIPELRDSSLFVDPFGGPDAEARCRAGLRAAHLWLRRGGALIVFPAGEVAHVRHSDGSRADSPWLPTMGRLALATGAKVIPARIDGRNSRMFYAVGRVHPWLRTLLLPRELLKKRGSTIAVRFGEAIAPSDLPDAPSATAFVRAQMSRLNMDTTSDAGRKVVRLNPEASYGAGACQT